MKTVTSFTVALVSAGITAASGFGQPAHAQSTAAQRVEVRYADLDLASASGRAALDRRIRAAVETACGTPSPADLRGTNLAAACRRTLAASFAAERAAVLAAAARRGAPAILLVARR